MAPAAVRRRPPRCCTPRSALPTTQEGQHGGKESNERRDTQIVSAQKQQKQRPAARHWDEAGIKNRTRLALVVDGVDVEAAAAGRRQQRAHHVYEAVPQQHAKTGCNVWLAPKRTIMPTSHLNMNLGACPAQAVLCCLGRA